MASVKLELNEKNGHLPTAERHRLFRISHLPHRDRGVVQKLRRDSIQRMRSKVKYWAKAYPAREISKKRIIDCFRAWTPTAAHGDTYALRLKYAKKVSEIIGRKSAPGGKSIPPRKSRTKEENDSCSLQHRNRWRQSYLPPFLFNEKEEKQMASTALSAKAVGSIVKLNVNGSPPRLYRGPSGQARIYV